MADADLQQAARVNDKGNFGVPFRETLDDALVTRHEKHGDFINIEVIVAPRILSHPKVHRFSDYDNDKYPV